MYSVDSEKTHPTPLPLTLETAYGSVKHESQPADWKAVSRAARDAKVDEAVRELADG